jgi:hypothetical protein
MKKKKKKLIKIRYKNLKKLKLMKSRFFYYYLLIYKKFYNLFFQVGEGQKPLKN